MGRVILNLQKSPLFENISESDIEKLCKCLMARTRKIAKNSFVFRSGDPVRNVYLIISGSMHIINEYFGGDRSIIETMGEYTLLGEAYAFAKKEHHIVSVIAAEDSVILEMHPTRLFGECQHSCSCHQQLIKNTINILSQKIIRLTEKVEHIVQRTTRDKVLSYLSGCMYQVQKNPFTIPYSRQQLADYLCVDRSALSHELCKLRDAKIIKFHKNQFELLLNEDDYFLNSDFFGL